MIPNSKKIDKIDKENEALEIIDNLYGIIDDKGNLDSIQQAMLDVLEWIFGDGDKPEIY